MWHWRPIVLAGLLAGLTFAGYSMVAFAIEGRGVWRPLNLVAHTLWRGAPTDDRSNLGAIGLGLVTAVAAGVVLFVPYAGLALGAGMRGAYLVGGPVIFGNVAWIIGHYFVWPSADPVAAASFSASVAWVAHMLAGLVGGFVLDRKVPPLPDVQTGAATADRVARR